MDPIDESLADYPASPEAKKRFKVMVKLLTNQINESEACAMLNLPLEEVIAMRDDLWQVFLDISEKSIIEEQDPNFKG
jgi:uncharacterized protein (DUF1697 family)